MKVTVLEAAVGKSGPVPVLVGLVGLSTAARSSPQAGDAPATGQKSEGVAARVARY